jgi:hypothetical protein
MTPRHLVMVSKSPWLPAVRREHALAQQAVASGNAVTFLEQPTDLRALQGPQRGRYLSELVTGPHPNTTFGNGALVLARGVLAPGHRGKVALRTETALLGRDLRRVNVGPESVVVANTPWVWPAVRRSGAARRVIDLADDWSALIPERAELMHGLHRVIADEADDIVVASPALADIFPDRKVIVVRNATDDSALTLQATPPPKEQRLVAVGTLSERFDADLVGALLDRLPDWRLSLFGECKYAGRDGVPSVELQRLLDREDRRVAWHGVVDREKLPQTLDAADVLLIVHRPELSRGQDSMKLYDYAARGRPVVCTTGALPVAEARPPHLYVADTAHELATAVRAAADETGQEASDRIAWAAQNVWSSRWPEWWSAVTGLGRAS